jgi:hypothetical protein
MIPPKSLPYPGLRAFARDESDLFFGRDGCVDAMVDRLAATRFLAVLGASGSGKSSLVRTGLLDALDLGFHPWAGSQWTVADLHPGGQPIRNLATALLRSKDGGEPEGMSIDLLAAFLRRGPRSVAEWASGGNLEPQCNLLILVDQFEELFRYGNYARQEEAEAFVTLLLETAAMPDLKVHVVVTMRSEFLGACALMPGLAEKINAGLYLTPRMSRDECREAIQGPAGVMGFTVEPALVNRLLNDLASFAPWDAGDSVDQVERLARRADQLPLMQHVLNRLWARASAEANGAGVVLTLADYAGLGGLSGALDAHGKEILSALGDARAGSVETVFRSLVSGSGVAAAVRRPCRMGELVRVTGNREDVVAIVEAFRAPDCNFLRTSEQSLSGDDVIVDISHESLIRQWTPLRGWLENEARASAAWQRLVTAEERYSRGEGDLLTGLDLGALAAWWESVNPTRAWASRHGGEFEKVSAYLDASRRADAAQTEAERRRQMRETYGLRIGLAVLLTALAFAVGFGVLAHFRRQQLQGMYSVLKENNEKLDIQNKAAIQARQEALNQLSVANKATQAAEVAKKAAEEANLVVRVKNTQLTQARNLVYSDRFTEIGELRLEFDKSITPQSSEKEPRTTQARNPVQPDRFKGPLDGDSAPGGSVNGLIEGDLSKQVIAARKSYEQEGTAEHLASLRLATNKLYEVVKLKRKREADSLQNELVADAEKLVNKMPGNAAYRVAWIILLDQGERLKSSDGTAARKAFTRSLELAELLPEDTASDLHERVVSYERLGDQDLAGDRIDAAREWYTKEVEAVRKAYSLEATAGSLSSLKIAMDRLYNAQVKLKHQSEAQSLQKELADDAEKLVEKSPGAETYRVALSIFIDQGERLRSTDRAAARKVFARGVALADLLPEDNATDLYQRVVIYERLGDQDSADGKIETASVSYVKEVEAARKIHAMEATADNLASLKIAINRLYQAHVKLNHQPQADALEKELVDDAEKLVEKTPGAEVYRVAWGIRADQGDRLKVTDQASAREAFARSLELAQRLPGDNISDLYKRSVSYERLGDQDVADGLVESARARYAKEVDIDRKRFAQEATAENFESLRISTNRLYDTEVKLKQQAAADAVQKSLISTADAFLTHSQTDPTLREVILVYTKSAEHLSSAGDSIQAQRYLARGGELALKLSVNTPEGAYARYQSFNAIANALVTQGMPAAAHAAYLQASSSLEGYILRFRTASPSRSATADNGTVADKYGSLSFMDLLGGDFSKALEAAQRGLAIEPDAAWIEANLAHALLLSGNQPEAIEHYMKVRKGTVGQRSMVDATAEDFGILKSLGFGHPAMDAILKQMKQE